VTARPSEGKGGENPRGKKPESSRQGKGGKTANKTSAGVKERVHYPIFGGGGLSRRAGEVGRKKNIHQ